MEETKLSVSYFWEIYQISFREIWRWLGIPGKLIDGIFLFGILFYKLISNDFASLAVWLGEFDVWSTVFWIALLVIPFLALINSLRVAAIRDKEQRDKFLLKLYDDIEVKKYETPETISEQVTRMAKGKINRKLEISIRNNGNTSLFDCSVRIAKLSLLDSKYNNEIPPPELRALRWIEGDEPKNGKVDLHAKSLPYPMWIASAEVNPIVMFKFVFWNHISESYYFVPGFYELIVQLEGQRELEGKRVDIIPIEFSIVFNFNIGFINPIFEIIKIKKLPRNNKE